MKSELVAYVKDHLFSTPEEMKKAKLSMTEQNRILRIRDMYTFWLQYPRTADKDIIAELKKRHGVGSSVAYEDLRLIKTCLGNFNQVTKDYDRYRFRQMCERGWEMAEKNNDANAHAKVTAAYGKFCQLDKEDSDAPAYSDIVVQVRHPTDDPRSIGFKPIPDFRKKAHQLLSQFRKEAQDTEYEEVDG